MDEITRMAAFAKPVALTFLALVLLVNGITAMFCTIGQEPDPSSCGIYGWVNPLPDPCKCTEIKVGGVNPHTPRRPFNVTYSDAFLQSNKPVEIRKWLNCTVVTCPPLQMPHHGVVRTCSYIGQSTPPTDQQQFGSSCDLGCEDGYILVGSASRGCLADGTWDGTETECVDTCLSNPCQNRGTCQLVGDKVNWFSCDCPPEYTGSLCQYEVCNPGSCECPPLFFGSYCKNYEDPCNSNTCENGGSCYRFGVSGNRSFCKCAHGYYGNTCQYGDPCNLHSCGENGVCYPDNRGTNYTCICLESWHGSDCREPITCDPSPCLNGGTCKFNYRCECPPGYIGSLCQYQDVLPSCRAYVEAGRSHGSSLYDIKLQCNFSTEPKHVYCDQRSIDGGWILLLGDDFSCSEWTADEISCLGSVTKISGFALSNSADTIGTVKSWILDEGSFRSFEVARADIIANLAGCRAPLGTSWNQAHNKGTYVLFEFDLLTTGSWFDDGCGNSTEIRASLSISFDGSWFERGQFVLSCYNSGGQWVVVSQWSTTEMKALWVKI